MVALRSLRLSPLLRLGVVLAPVLAALVLPAPVRSQTTVAAGSDPSSKGAEVYCFMRQSGNDHEVSWTAAYALIKRQSASLFKNIASARGGDDHRGRGQQSQCLPRLRPLPGGFVRLGTGSLRPDPAGYGGQQRFR